MGFPTSDNLGRSVQVSITIPPSVRRIATILVQKESLGFKTEQDVFRQCLAHALPWLQNQAKDPDVIAEFGLLTSWIRICQDQAERQLYLKSLSSIRNCIRDLISAGRAVKALEIADMAWRDHDKVVDTYWRAEYRRVTKGLLDETQRAYEKEEKEKDRESA